MISWSSSSWLSIIDVRSPLRTGWAWDLILKLLSWLSLSVFPFVFELLLLICCMKIFCFFVEFMGGGEASMKNVVGVIAAIIIRYSRWSNLNLMESEAVPREDSEEYKEIMWWFQFSTNCMIGVEFFATINEAEAFQLWFQLPLWIYL